MTTAPESDACMVQKGNDPEKGLLPYRGHMTTPGLIETCELLPENDPTNKRFFQNIVSNETSSFLALPAPAVSGAK
jgi:hypothetical protein